MIAAVDLSGVGVVVLAAGKGTRMQSGDLPKVMLPIGGRPMLEYSIETLEKIGFPPNGICIVVGYRKEVITEYFRGRAIFSVQEQLLGTGHAAVTGSRALPGHIRTILTLQGDDSAFYSTQTLRSFVSSHVSGRLMLSAMTAEVATPGDLGRVMRYPDGRIEIVEKEYLTEEQRALNEVNTNTFCIDRTWFEAAFVNLPLMATLGEYGLPSVLSMAQESGLPVRIVKLGCNEWYGVNSKEDLLVADRRMRQKRSEDSPRTPT